jgi:hypothetical protein
VNEPAPETTSPETTSPAAPVPTGRAGSGWWRRAWPYLVVVTVALAGSALHTARYAVLSPFDESRHLDYMARIYEDGYVVKLGDKLADTAMRLEACRGVDVPDYVPPPCATRRFDPVAFRDEGYNNAVNNPPLYYLVTGGVASAADGIGLSDSILDPARLMGGVWLAAGLAMVVFAGDCLRVRRVPLVAAAVIFALAPEPLFMAATVNADSAAVFAGALTLVVGLAWERRRLPVAWLAVVGVLVAALKMTNLIGVGIVVLWFLTQAVRVRGRDPGTGRTTREYLWAVALLVGGAVGMTLLWIAIAGARATIDALALPSNAQFYEPGFPWQAFALRQNVFSLFPPLGGLRPPVLATRLNDTIAYASGWLAGAVVIVAALRFDARRRLVTLGAWTGAVLLVAGPGFILSTWVVNRVIFQPVARYGLSAIPMLILATGAIVRGRVGTVLLAAFALLAAGTVLGTLALG